MNVIQGCTCCGGCDPIATDDFNRSNSANINTGAPFTWSGDTSSAEVFSNQLLFSAFTTGNLQCGTSNPDNTGSGVVRCTFTTGDDGDAVEVWLNGTNSANCTVARYVVGTSGGTLDIRTRISSSDTVVVSETINLAAGQIDLELIYDASRGLAQATLFYGSGSTLVICNLFCTSISEIGDFSGFAVADSYSEIYADDYYFEPLGDGTNQCPTLGCVGACELTSDDFNRSNSTNITTGYGCTWTEVSGSWEISSNTLVCTATGIAIHTGSYPSNIVLTADITRSGTSTARLIFGFLNTSNYYWAEYTATTISIGRQSFGATQTLTTKAATVTASVTYEAKVCIEDATGWITAYLDGTAIVSTGDYSPLGTDAGGGATIVSSNSVTFDNFLVETSQADADECEACVEPIPDGCDSCPIDTENPNLRFYVDLGAGGLTDICTCCDQFAGEWTLTVVSSCIWNAQVNSNCGCTGTAGNIRLRIAKYEDKCFIRVSVEIGTEDEAGVFGYAQYEIAITEPSMDQNDSPWTLTKSPGHTATYRGIGGWEDPGEDWSTDSICGGTLPSTIGVRVGYV